MNGDPAMGRDFSFGKTVWMQPDCPPIRAEGNPAQRGTDQDRGADHRRSCKEGIAQNRIYFDPLVIPLSSDTKNGLVLGNP